VSRYLLDTNIIGNVTKPSPSLALIAWMADRADEDLFISSLTVAEILRGILGRPAGKKRWELERWFYAARVLRRFLPAGCSRLMRRPASYGRA
jgi:toxin FitB